jgi:hypothetical protein
MGIFSFVKPGKKIFKTITSVKPNVPTNKAEILKRDLNLATQKRKASESKLDNTIFKIEQQKDRLKGKILKKGKELAKGGRVGLKRGTGLMKKKSNVDKIKKTFGTLSVRAGIDNNPNPTYADKIAGAKMKNKKKKKFV